jgi:glycosyl transferase, family 25
MSTLLSVDKVFYINLEERTDRKLMVQRELLKLFPYDVIERYPATRVEGHGALGCALSHIGVLKLAMSRGYKKYIVVEDDIQILDLDTLKKGMEQFSAMNVRCDVLLLTANTYNFRKTQLKHIIKTEEAFAAMAYMVPDSYYSTLLANFEESAAQLAKTKIDHMYAIDVGWKPLQKKDVWLQLFPVTIIQRPDHSDIVGTTVDYTDSILKINKYYNESETGN